MFDYKPYLCLFPDINVVNTLVVKHCRFISSLINRLMLMTSLWTDWAAFIWRPLCFCGDCCSDTPHGGIALRCLQCRKPSPTNPKARRASVGGSGTVVMSKASI